MDKQTKQEMNHMFSLMERMDKHLTLDEAESNENIPLFDENFDLTKIPIEILDNGWKRYHPYVLMIDHDNPLAYRSEIAEGTNYKKQIEDVKNAIINTFPIDEKQFLIKEGNHGLYFAILTCTLDDNIEVLEKSMEDKGFFRSQPTGDKILRDLKNRKWIDIRFEPKDPDDVTEEVRRKFEYLYHIAPNIFSENIKKNGIITANNNSEYRYYEPRVFVCEGNITEEEKKQLAKVLYTQAQNKGIKNLTNIYSFFTIDLNKIDRHLRFYYDINEKKGLYTKFPIPSSAIVKEDIIIIEKMDKL